MNQELVREQKSPRNDKVQRVKYCCLCAGRGHYADQCSRANRVAGPLNVDVVSYRNLLKMPSNSDKKGPKCTILSSDLENFNFNFGNDVSNTRNTIYGRFCRATNLNLNESTTSENDVVFVNESNLHDMSDPPIEVYDDFDFEMDHLDDVSSSEQFSENTHDDSFVTIDNLDADEEEPKSDTTNVDNLPADKAAAIKRLDDKIHTLEELKGKMLSQKSNDDINLSCQSINNDTTIESEANVSEQKDDVTTSTALPDFIPLSSGEPEKFEITRSPSPVSADSTTTTNEKTDATILLTKQNCKVLLSEEGNKFLRDSEVEHNVSVRLEWRQYGNILIVHGIAKDQQDFRNILKDFFQSTGNQQKLAPSQSQMPKNRNVLMKFIRDNVAALDSPMCNHNVLADVQGIYYKIRRNENNPSKANAKQIIKSRKQLNMILFGRYGLGEGKFHLDALQELLRRVRDGNGQNVSVEVRQKIAEHFDYIFSSNDHKNYEDMIDQYQQMRRDRTLPPLMLDRKLMGLKINVYPNDGPDDSKRNVGSFRPPRGNSTIPNDNNMPDNRLNKPPSLLDIQINVSSPSTSSPYQQNQPMYRRNPSNFPSNRGRVMDKWKF